MPTTAAVTAPLRGPSGWQSSLALLRFQWNSGLRVAWQTLTPLVTALFVGALLVGSEMAASFVDRLLAGDSGARTIVLLALIASLAGTAPRVNRGTTGGWIAHLPASVRVRRRSLVVAHGLALLPLAGLVLALIVASGPTLGEMTRASMGLLVALLGISVSATPMSRFRQGATFALGAISSYVALDFRWTRLVLAITLVVLTDLVAGKLGTVSRVPVRTRSSRVPTEASIVGRALDSKWSGAYLMALLPLLAGFAFLTNNVLEAPGRRLGAILACGCALTALVAVLAEELAVRRPPWPRARSLPWSSSRRVAGDVAIFAVAGLPLVGFGAFLEIESLFPCLVLTLLIATWGGRAVRRSAAQRIGAGGEVLAVGLLASAWVALAPLLGSISCLVVVPWLFASAARREAAVAIGRWDARHHSSLGDSLDVG